MKCRVDPDRCEAHHRCINLYPELFEIGEHDKARAKADGVTEELEIEAQSAANSCPAGAIIIEY